MSNSCVLMVSAEYPPALGGVGDYVETLCRHLAAIGIECRVLTSAGLDPRASEADAGGPPVLREIRRWDFRSWGSIRSAARRAAASVVHIQYQAAAYGMHPSANLLPYWLRTVLPKPRVVTTFHDLRVPYLFPKAGALRWAAIRALDARSHATVLTNREDMALLGGPGSAAWQRRRVIPIGSSIPVKSTTARERAAHRGTVGAGDSTLVLSHFGLMSQTKGVDQLLLAVSELAGRGLGVRLVVIGGEAGTSDPSNRTYSARIQAMLRSAVPPGLVHTTGAVSPGEVSAWLLASDLCVLPYADGASPRRTSLLTALEHGLPVVSTWAKSPDPAFVDGENLALVEPGSPGKLADTIEYLWRHPATMRRLSQGALATAREFGWDKIAASHQQLYAELR